MATRLAGVFRDVPFYVELGYEPTGGHGLYVEQAIELLAICASQPEWALGVRTVPGSYCQASRELANAALGIAEAVVWDVTDEWRESYAAAEAALRDVLRGDATVWWRP